MLVAFMNEFMRPPFDLAAHREKAERWTEALQQGEEYRTKGRDNGMKSMLQQARTLFFFYVSTLHKQQILPFLVLVIMLIMVVSYGST